MNRYGIKRILAIFVMLSIFLGMTGVTAQAAASLQAPTGVTVKATSAGNPKISWKEVEGASGYVVYRMTSDDSKYVKVISTKKLNCTDRKWSAKEGTDIKYAVKAYVKDASGKTTWSKNSAVKKWTVPVKGIIKTAPTVTPTPKPTATPVPTVTPTPKPTATPTSAPVVNRWQEKDTSRSVYISKTGSCYHSSATCSNMKSATLVTLGEALEKGLRACSKCW